MMSSGRIDTVVSNRRALEKPFDGVDLRQFPVVEENDDWVVLSAVRRQF